MTINNFVSDWFPMIDSPIITNGKQGFLLNNGWRIYFSKPNLSNVNKGTLKRHYSQTINAKEQVRVWEVDKKRKSR